MPLKMQSKLKSSMKPLSEDNTDNSTIWKQYPFLETRQTLIDIGIILRDEIINTEQIASLKCKAFVYLIAPDCQSGESCFPNMAWLGWPDHVI